MTMESDTKLILATADKLIVRAGELTKRDTDVAVAALGVAMMCLAKACDITRSEINALIDIAEKELGSQP